MTNFLCSCSQQIQSQSAYSVDEFSEMLQREANLNLNTATAISANLDQLDGAADGQIAARSYYDRRLLESAVDNQLCEVPSYKRLGLTSDTLGLVQSGCRYDEIDAAKLTLARYLNPNFVEPELAPAVPVQKRVSERLVAEANNPFENIDFEVEEASFPAPAIALLVLNRANLQMIAGMFGPTMPELEAEIQTLLGLIENTKSLLATTTGKICPSALRVTLEGTWSHALLSSAYRLRDAGPSAPIEVVREFRTNLIGTTSVLRNAAQSLTNLQPATQSVIVNLAGQAVNIRSATPVFEAFAAEAGAGVSEVRIVIDAVDDVVPAAQTRTVVAEAGPMVRAQAAPVVQSLRSAGFSGGPYTRPLLLVAGAAVLIGAGWYWLRDE